MAVNPDVGHLFIVLEIMELTIYSRLFLVTNCIQHTKPELNLNCLTATVLVLVNLLASDSCSAVTT